MSSIDHLYVDLMLYWWLLVRMYSILVKYICTDVSAGVLIKHRPGGGFDAGSAAA